MKRTYFNCLRPDCGSPRRFGKKDAEGNPTVLERHCDKSGHQGKSNGRTERQRKLKAMSPEARRRYRKEQRKGSAA